MTSPLAVQISFFVLAVASTASALGVISFRNAVYSALSLILTLILLALFYLLLGAEFISIVQILIYAGAIMVLFLFVVTMLSPDQDQRPAPDAVPWQRPLAGLLGVVLVGALSFLLFSGGVEDPSAKAAGANSLSHVVNTQGNVEAFGLALFHGFMFPFEVTSLLIVIAILGALVFGRKA